MASFQSLLVAAFPCMLCIYFTFWRRKSLKQARERSLNFSEIKALVPFDHSIAQPYAYRPWKPGKYNMTMGIQKMAEDDWLIIDNLYEEEQELRRHLLLTDRESVLQCLPIAEKASIETLECIVHFLIHRYPMQFRFLKEKPGYIHNAIIDKAFKVTPPYASHPLEIAAQLVMEDINLLLEGAGHERRECCLGASFSMAPAGWDIRERIGWPLWRLHGPVPSWEDKLRKATEKFLHGLKVERPVQRNNFFIQVGKTMFQQTPFADSLPSPPRATDIYIRHERQTLRRLPRSGAVLFLVRTYLLPLTALEREKESLLQLREAINAWPPEMAKYKGRHVWGSTMEAFCDEVLQNSPPRLGQAA